MKFEWDPRKERINIEQHGVTFEEACYVFSDPYGLSRYDDEHSEEEDRWLLLGRSMNQTLLVVVHLITDEAGSEFVRIISARKANRKERLQYQHRSK